MPNKETRRANQINKFQNLIVTSAYCYYIILHIFIVYLFTADFIIVVGKRKQNQIKQQQKKKKN